MVSNKQQIQWTRNLQKHWVTRNSTNKRLFVQARSVYRNEKSVELRIIQ